MHNQLLTNRSLIKSDRISKILSAYSAEHDKSIQQSSQMLSQKIKRKIGNQLSEHQTQNTKIEQRERKNEISKFCSEHKKNQLQISVKDLLLHKSQIQKQQTKKPRESLNRQTEIIEKLNKTQNEIYKSYLAQRNCNGSKTYRDSRDLDIRIKLNDKSTQSQQALLQTLINKSHEKKSVEPRDSPDLCSTPHNLFTILQQSVNAQSSLLVRSGSQGNVAAKQLNNKESNIKLSKIKNYLEQAKTYRQTTDAYKLNLLQESDKIKKHRLLQVENIKIQSILNIANKAKQKLDSFTEFLTIQDKAQSLLNGLIVNELSHDDSIESIQSLE